MITIVNVTNCRTFTQNLPMESIAQHGLNKFAGYLGVATAGIITAYLATAFGARTGLLAFGMAVIVLALALTLTLLWVKDTLPWARAESLRRAEGTAVTTLTTMEVFTLMSWRDKRLMALCQAGFVEKFVDALVWVFYPVFLYQRGVSLPNIGWIVGIYGLVWGGSQLFTGRLSDRIGRYRLNVWGMALCGAGVVMMSLYTGMAWWSLSAALTGFGMAMLYPNLSAAVADIAHPSWRGSAIGIYRFWRDLGYGIGASGLGLTASASGKLEVAFWFVTISMFVSAAVLWWWGEETHPHFRPNS